MVCSLSALQDELERRRKGRGFTLDAVQHCSGILSFYMLLSSRIVVDIVICFF